MSEACKWHENDEPLKIEPDGFGTPGCQECGMMLDFKECEGCGQAFLDWEAKGHDDIISGPYVTTGGDLLCIPCGRRSDEAEEEESDGNYAYDPEYDGLP